MFIPLKAGQRGGGLLPALRATTDDIIDYLQATHITFDPTTLDVHESRFGTTIKARPQQIVPAAAAALTEEASEADPYKFVPFAWNHVYAYDGPPVTSNLVDTKGSEIGEMNRFSYTDRTELTTSQLEFGFSKMDVCINGFYGDIYGTGLYRTLSGSVPSGMPASSTWGYSLEELMQPVVSADQYYYDRNGAWAPLVDDGFLIGTLRLRTQLSFLSGNATYPNQDYTFDPIWGVWKVTHELGPTRAHFYNDWYSDNRDSYNPPNMRRLEDTNYWAPSYFNYLAEYIIYDFNNWLLEHREKGKSSQTVKFRWRQLDFSPTQMIPVNNYIRNQLWEHQYDQEHEQ